MAGEAVMSGLSETDASSLTVSPAGTRVFATDEIIFHRRLPAGAGLRPLASVLIFLQAHRFLQVRHEPASTHRRVEPLQPAFGLRNFRQMGIADAGFCHVTKSGYERCYANLSARYGQAECRFANNDVTFLVVLK